MHYGFRGIGVLVLCLVCFAGAASAQLGNSGSIEGTVKDPSGAIVPGATVEINSAVSAYSRTTTAGADGSFGFTNVPFNPYHLTVSAGKFAVNGMLRTWGPACWTPTNWVRA
jgi:hypothetical protein